jgi:hypothetical protein
VVGDIAFVLATSKLADLRGRALRKRSLDVELLLDDVCQDGLLPSVPSVLPSSLSVTEPY